MFRRDRRSRDVNNAWMKALKRKKEEKGREPEVTRKSRRDRRDKDSMALHQREPNRTRHDDHHQGRVTVNAFHRPGLFGEMRQSHKMAPEPRNRPKVPLKIPPQQDEGDYFKRLQEPEPFKGDFDHEVDDVNFDFAKIGMPRLKKLRQPIVQMPTGSLYQFEFPVERRTAKKVVPLSPVPPPRRLTASSLNELPDNGFSLPSQQEHCDNPVISKYFESFTCNNVQRATNGGGHNEPACFGSIFRATRTRGTLARGSPGQLGAPMAVKEATRTTSGPPFKTLDWGVEVDSMVDRVSGLPLPSEALKAIQESMQIGYERFLTQRLPSSDLITVEKKQNRIISLANRNGIPLTANFVEDMFEKRHRGFEPPKTNPALNHPLDLTDDELDHDDEPFFF